MKYFKNLAAQGALLAFATFTNHKAIAIPEMATSDSDKHVFFPNASLANLYKYGKFL